MTPFQSTPSGGKATCTAASAVCTVDCFNPRLPGGRRRRAARQQALDAVFQSTPSGGKATRILDAIGAINEVFQSTPSGGKATSRLTPSALAGCGFQSTPSGGKATDRFFVIRHNIEFQSTPSGGKATRFAAVEDAEIAFQSTPSGGKATGCGGSAERLLRGFNPRLPGGRRRVGDGYYRCC